jgi:hypothetical protein
MKKLACLITLLVPLLVNQQSLAHDCNFSEGEDRWSIKTSVTDGALDQAVQEVDLSSLIDSTNPTLSKQQKTAIANRRWSGRLSASDKGGNHISLKEGDMISVEGFLYRARCQKDGDYHLEIGTANNDRTQCLIVEAPDPGQVADSSLKDRVSAVRGVLDSFNPGIFTGKAKAVAVKVTGQFFLDAHHIGAGDPGGGRGTNHCATNVWEIHPVIAIESQ